MTVTTLADAAAETSTASKRGFVQGLPVRDRCLVMGIVNVTPDSFSDGGRFFEADRAINHGLGLARAGADIVDVGGESTRPGAGRIPEAEELRRVLPVIRELADAGVPVSIDTMRSRVATEALEAGAIAVNDVSGGLADPAMAARIGEAHVPYIAMHWRAHSADMQRRAVYDDVIAEVTSELTQRALRLIDAGIEPQLILLDPGIGFAKLAQHSWRLLAHIDQLRALGYPVLIGASRKSFLAAVSDADDRARSLDVRDAATAAVSALAAAAGAFCVRVHEVRSSLDAVRVAAAWQTSTHRLGPALESHSAH